MENFISVGIYGEADIPAIAGAGFLIAKYRFLSYFIHPPLVSGRGSFMRSSLLIARILLSESFLPAVAQINSKLNTLNDSHPYVLFGISRALTIRGASLI